MSQSKRKMTVDEEYSSTYKISSVMFYIVASISMEEVNQKLYRQDFPYIFTTIALQQGFIAIMMPFCGWIAKGKQFPPAIDNIMQQFVIDEMPSLKAWLMLAVSAAVWALNVGLGRVVAATFGSGPLDVMKSLIVPFSALNVFIYYRKKQSKTAMLGIFVMSSAFLINLPNLTKDYEIIGVDGEVTIEKRFSYAYLCMGIAIGFIASHQTLVSQHFLKYVGGNAMKMMLLHTPWAGAYFGFYAYVTGEFNGKNILFGTENTSEIKATGELAYGVFEKLSMESTACKAYFFIAIVFGFVVNLATMNMLQATSVVTNNVTAQSKSALGATIGYFNKYLDTNLVPSNSQIAATFIKSVGSGIYTSGKIIAAKKASKKLTNIQESMRRQSMQSMNRRDMRRQSTQSMNRRDSIMSRRLSFVMAPDDLNVLSEEDASEFSDFNTEEIGIMENQPMDKK